MEKDQNVYLQFVVHLRRKIWKFVPFHFEANPSIPSKASVGKRYLSLFIKMGLFLFGMFLNIEVNVLNGYL